MGWLDLSQHVGINLTPVPMPQKSAPTTVQTVNPYLKPIADAEAGAQALSGEAAALAQDAAAKHDGYAAAFAKIGAATSAWRSVQRLADKILAADDLQSSPEKIEWMHQAKVAVPGIIESAHQALMHLLDIHRSLQADQSAKRPDIPPASDLDPYADSGFGWGALAILGGIGYLLWKAVF